jgi:hypothetical protein
VPGPFLAVLGFVSFAIAGILELVKPAQDAKAVIWLVIIGGLLVCAAAWAFGWYYRRGASAP